MILIIKKLQTFGILMLAVIGLSSMTYIIQQERKPWEVPEEYKNMENPTKDNPDLKTGKMLYNKHCKSCHGNKGLGDGPKARMLETFSGDFSKDLDNQTDGEVFYKSLIGRDEMPNYEKKIPDETDMWNIVNYMRTFSKEKK